MRNGPLGTVRMDGLYKVFGQIVLMEKISRQLTEIKLEIR